MRLWLAACAAVATAACADLEDVAEGVCGNGVVEVGEDCEADGVDADGAPTLCGELGGANQCAFECSADVACPAGYACGTDLRCRQPGGMMIAGPSLGFVADQLVLDDVDGDAFTDVVSAGGSTVEIRFGSAQADLAATLVTPVSTPPAGLATGDLDDDGDGDVVVATAPGVLTFLGGGDGTLDPFAYPLAAFAPGSSTAFGRAVQVDTRGADVDDEILLVWGDQIGFPLAPGAGVTAVTGLPVPGVGQGPPDPDVFDLPAQTLSVGGLADHRDVDGDDDDTLEVPIGYAGGREIHLLQVSGPTDAAPARPLTTDASGQVVTLAAGHTVRGGSGIFLGYFDDDGCLDLLAHVDTPVAAVQRLVVARGVRVVDTCTGALAAPADVVNLSDDELRLLGVADLDGDGTTDVVTSVGLYRTEPTDSSPVELVRFPEVVNDAVVVDVNGDGRPDVATFREGRPDVDVLINAGATFNRFVVPTSAAVQRLAAGDFDGDLVADLAIVEVDSSGDDVAFAVSVSFGEQLGAPSEAVVMDRLPAIGGLVAGKGAGADGADGVDDLLLLRDAADADEVEATVLFGSGARAMVSPLTLQTELAVGVQQPLAVALGQLDGEAGLDLFAVGSRGSAFVYAGDGTGGFALADAAAWPVTGFLVEDSLWAAGDVDGDGRDELAAAERHTDRAFVGPVRVLLFGADLSGLDGPLGSYDMLRGARRLAFDDLDGDGDLDLLVAILGRQSERDHVVAIGWNDGGAIAALSALPDGESCHDAARIQLDGDASPELVALCVEGGQLVARRYDASEPETLLPSGTIAQVAGTVGALEVGDVDGDGLADLLVATRASATVTIRVFLQLDLHAL